MAEPPNGVQRQLGELVGELRGVNKRLDNADEGRAKIHVRLDGQDRVLGKLEATIGRIDDRLKIVEGQTSKSLEVVERVEGYERDGKRVVSIISGAGSRVVVLLRWLAVAAGAIAWTFWREIIDYLSGR
jgi:hypothetical protein